MDFFKPFLFLTIIMILGACSSAKNYISHLSGKDATHIVYRTPLLSDIFQKDCESQITPICNLKPLDFSRLYGFIGKKPPKPCPCNTGICPKPKKFVNNFYGQGVRIQSIVYTSPTGPQVIPFQTQVSKDTKYSILTLGDYSLNGVKCTDEMMIGVTMPNNEAPFNIPFQY